MEYIYFDYLISGEFDVVAVNKWLPSSDLVSSFIASLRTSFRERGFDIGIRYNDTVDHLINKLLEEQIILFEGDEFTGKFWYIPVDRKDDYLKFCLKNNPVQERILRLGTEALNTALRNIAGVEDWAMSDIGTSDINAEYDNRIRKEDIPAADRYVRLDDNAEIRESIIVDIEKISELLRGDNDEDGKLGEVKQQIQAELVAGKKRHWHARARYGLYSDTLSHSLSRNLQVER